MQAHDYSTLAAFEKDVQSEYEGRNAEDARDFGSYFEWAKKAWLFRASRSEKIPLMSEGETSHEDIQEHRTL